MSADNPMRFAGDRMMTDLLSRISAAGVREITLDPGLGVISIEPTRWRRPFSSRKARIEDALIAIIRLMDEGARIPLYNGRTFSEALSFRTARMFETAGGAITIIPRRYEARPAD